MRIAAKRTLIGVAIILGLVACAWAALKKPAAALPTEVRWSDVTLPPSTTTCAKYRLWEVPPVDQAEQAADPRTAENRFFQRGCDARRVTDARGHRVFRLPGDPLICCTKNPALAAGPNP